MSTSENETGTPAETNSGAANDSSQRAKAIARRSFLRKSAGIAAPVVMTLQSGPALAIRSITCQDKTGQLQPNDLSGFTDEPNMKATDVINTDPTALVELNGNDGIVRCTKTSHAAGNIGIGQNFTDSGGGTWTFNTTNATFDNTTDKDGPVAYFTIVDGEETFVGCYGEGATFPQDETDSTTGEPYRPLTCSCWGSLNP